MIGQINSLSLEYQSWSTFIPSPSEDRAWEHRGGRGEGCGFSSLGLHHGELGCDLEVSAAKCLNNRCPQTSAQRVSCGLERMAREGVYRWDSSVSCGLGQKREGGGPKERGRWREREELKIEQVADSLLCITEASM